MKMGVEMYPSIFERINYLLACINGEETYDNTFQPVSRVEEILQSFILDTSYTGDVTSRLEKLFAVWCNFKPISILDFDPVSRSEQILWTKIFGGVYSGSIMSRCEELLIGLSGINENEKTDPIVGLGQVDYAILVS